jgi:hypothetical protein
LATVEIYNGLYLINNRIIKFLDDEYALIADGGVGTAGVYKRNQGGAGQWGQVYQANTFAESRVSGLFVVHPGGVPTLCFNWFSSPGDLYSAYSTDGTTWNITFQINLSNVSSSGQAVTFRDSIFWMTHSNVGLIESNFVLDTGAVIGATGYNANSRAPAFALAVHDNTLFVCGWGVGVYFLLSKFQTGALTGVYDDATRGAGVGQQPGNINTDAGRHAMFTDPATGDLIVFASGLRQGGGARTEVFRFQNATGSPTTSIISTVVLGSVQGGDKYLEGGGSAETTRNWFAYVDNDTDPLNPRVFLFTYGATNVTECWEWQGFGDGVTPGNAEIEPVGGGAGIDVSVYGMPCVIHGGGNRSVITSRIEIGDPYNQDADSTGEPSVLVDRMLAPSTRQRARAIPIRSRLLRLDRSRSKPGRCFTRRSPTTSSTQIC